MARRLCWCVKGLGVVRFFWVCVYNFLGVCGGFFLCCCCDRIWFFLIDCMLVECCFLGVYGVCFFFFFFGVWVVWKGQKLSKPRFFGAACNFVLVLLFGLFVVGKLWGGFFWGSGMGRKFCRVLEGIVSRFFFLIVFYLV